MTQCKRKVIEVLLQLDEMRVDYRLSLFVHSFRDARRRGEEWVGAPADDHTALWHTTTSRFRERVFAPLFDTTVGAALDIESMTNKVHARQ